MGAVVILIINAIAILSEDRFLARIGWASSSSYANNPASPDPHSFGMMPPQNDQSIKVKLINLISATRMLMRIPLIGINSLLIIYEMLLG
ncbi:hypothetical protein Q9L58_006179 [Maublancomyces gigas]|uniref:Immediate early response 3-interacting protein 1 n=1 Tax=Discina gigas TaxID=1032678 RepID=A0ABR3GG08_9PEZI